MLQRTDENSRIAALLREAAELLRAQGANPFRVNAYRKAADTVAGLANPVCEVFEDAGRAGLDALPGIDPAASAPRSSRCSPRSAGASSGACAAAPSRKTSSRRCPASAPARAGDPRHAAHRHARGARDRVPRCARARNARSMWKQARRALLRSTVVCITNAHSCYRRRVHS